MKTKEIQVIYKRGETNIVAVLKQDDSAETADLVIGPHTIYGSPWSEVLEEGGEVMSLDEASDLIDEVLEKQYGKPFVEIDEARYTKMLEVLPPEVWMTGNRFIHDDVEYIVDGFRMCEYMEYQWTDHFYKVRPVCYRDAEGTFWPINFHDGDWRYFYATRKADSIVAPNQGDNWVMDERATIAMRQYVDEVLAL
jgi:hypothetical protein